MPNTARALGRIAVVVSAGASYVYLVPERYRCFAFVFPLLALVYPPKGHGLAGPSLCGSLTAISTALYVWRRQGALTPADFGMLAVLGLGSFFAVLLLDLLRGRPSPADVAMS